MPATELDFKTIAAATAGLCLAAGAAAFLTSTPDQPDALSLAPAPSHLIVIEDDVEASVASMDALDPMQYAAVRGIVIEDDDMALLADASDAIVMVDEEPRGSSLFAAMAGSVAGVEVTIAAPTTSAPPRAFERAPRPSMDLARLSMGARATETDSDERVAMLDTSSKSSSSSHTGGSVSGARKAVLMPRPGLSPDQIASAIQQQLPKVRACYERQLKTDTALRGRMVLAMSVTASGDVSRARVKGDELGNDDLNACVVREVQGFRFPAGVESVAVEYPVTFKPQF